MRQQGFYWVKWLNNWEVAQWVTHDRDEVNGTWWMIQNEGLFSDNEFQEINEQRILSPEEIKV